MKGLRLTFRQWVGYAGMALVLLLALAVAIWQGDIIRDTLNPDVPFQTYEPPAAPDYRQASAWALLDARAPSAGPAAVFFLHSTTYDGGDDWNGPIGHREADAYLNRVVLPNYAGPFAKAGSVSAPLYRQSSLYSRLTQRDDAREARAFAYGDAEAAFDAWLVRHPSGPIVLAGVEQGGELIERLVRERVAVTPALRRRLVGVWLIDVIVARDGFSPLVPPCAQAGQVGCVVAWSPMPRDNDGAAPRKLRRALVWDARGRLVGLDGREPLCVNPVTGSGAETPVPARASRGATNATGLEWGARPALMAHEVETQCRDGFLWYTQPKLESLRAQGGWAERRKVRPYNLFYADIEADVQDRLMNWAATSARGAGANG